MTLVVKDLSVKRGDILALAHVSFAIERGECVGLIGPNGAGKTTLLRAALGLIPASGQSSLAKLTPRERARHAAWLPQAREIAWPIPVRTLVALGRTPHLAGGRKLSKSDEDAVERAITLTGIAELADRPATELSGGEQARVLLARALAQDASLLMADEPIAGLDPAQQIATMSLFKRIAAEGQTVLVALHDLSLAARYCSRLLMIDGGKLVADGPAVDVLRDDRVKEVFRVRGRWDEAGFQVLEAI